MNRLVCLLMFASLPALADEFSCVEGRRFDRRPPNYPHLHPEADRQTDFRKLQIR
jgi:hypothetical protein